MLGLVSWLAVLVALLVAVFVFGCGRGDRIGGANWLDLPVPTNRAARRRAR